MLLTGFWQVLRIRRCRLLLDLQEHRILRAVSLEQDHVVPQADAPSPHHLEPDIDAAEQIKEMTPLRGKVLAIRAERTENRLGLLPSNPPKARPQIPKTPLPVAVRLGELL